MSIRIFRFDGGWRYRIGGRYGEAGGDATTRATAWALCRIAACGLVGLRARELEAAA